MVFALLTKLLITAGRPSQTLMIRYSANRSTFFLAGMIGSRARECQIRLRGQSKAKLYL